MPYTPDELDKMTKPSFLDIFRAASKIIKHTFDFSELHNDEDREPLDQEGMETKFSELGYEFATREALARAPGVPQNIQSVNKALIRAGVTLLENNLVRLLRRAAIVTFPTHEGNNAVERLVYRMRQETKFIKNEVGLSEGFDESAKVALEDLIERVRQGEDITPAALERCKTQRTFDKTGKWVHYTCGFFGATLSEYDVIRETFSHGFSIGAESDVRNVKP
jgi:hypothetical protein